MANPIDFIMKQMINQNPEAYRRAQQMCDGKTEEEMKTLILNLAKSQGRDIGQLKQFAATFGIRL